MKCSTASRAKTSPFILRYQGNQAAVEYSQEQFNSGYCSLFVDEDTAPIDPSKVEFHVASANAAFAVYLSKTGLRFIKVQFDANADRLEMESAILSCISSNFQQPMFVSKYASFPILMSRANSKSPQVGWEYYSQDFVNTNGDLGKSRRFLYPCVITDAVNKPISLHSIVNNLLKVLSNSDEHDVGYIEMMMPQRPAAAAVSKYLNLSVEKTFDLIATLFADLMKFSAKTRFIHNDLHAGNILYDRTKGRLVVIDFGRSFMNLREYDQLVKSDLKQITPIIDTTLFGNSNSNKIISDLPNAQNVYGIFASDLRLVPDDRLDIPAMLDVGSVSFRMYVSLYLQLLDNLQKTDLKSTSMYSEFRFNRKLLDSMRCVATYFKIGSKDIEGKMWTCLRIPKSAAYLQSCLSDRAVINDPFMFALAPGLVAMGLYILANIADGVLDFFDARIHMRDYYYVSMSSLLAQKKNPYAPLYPSFVINPINYDISNNVSVSNEFTKLQQGLSEKFLEYFDKIKKSHASVRGGNNSSNSNNNSNSARNNKMNKVTEDDAAETNEAYEAVFAEPRDDSPIQKLVDLAEKGVYFVFDDEMYMPNDRSAAAMTHATALRPMISVGVGGVTTTAKTPKAAAKAPKYTDTGKTDMVLGRMRKVYQAGKTAYVTYKKELITMKRARQLESSVKKAAANI